MQENTRCLQKNYFMKKILVIKHGALGDLIQTTGIFRSISEHHKNDDVVLLVDKKFKFFIENACSITLSSSYKFKPFLLPIFGAIIPLKDIDETFCDFLNKERKLI